MDKFIRRVKLWFKRYKHCNKCCLFCEWFEECENDIGKGVD